MNIIVNGQQYADWASIPAGVRRMLAQTLPDMDEDGVPDLLEHPPGVTGSNMVSSLTVNVNGQTYTSADQMPPELQELLRQALGGLTGAGTAAPTPAGPAAPAAPLPTDQVLLNGVPTPVDPKPEKKRWWQRLTS